MLLSLKTLSLAWRLFKAICWPVLRVVRWGNATNRRSYVWLFILVLWLLPLEIQLLNFGIRRGGGHPLEFTPLFPTPDLAPSFGWRGSPYREQLFYLGHHYVVPIVEWLMVASVALALWFQFLFIAPVLMLLPTRKKIARALEVRRRTLPQLGPKSTSEDVAEVQLIFSNDSAPKRAENLT